MRYLIKKLILVLPYQFRKRYLKRHSLRHTMHEALQQIRDVGFTPDYIIDVGTAGGTHAILSVFRKAFYVWIEPLKEFEPRIRALKQRFRGDYFICAAGSVSGKLTINIHSDLVGSSLLKEEDGTKSDGIPREIDVITLDSLLDNYPEVKQSKVLLKLDVQGFELEVLDGAAKILDCCEAVILEVSMFKFQKTAPEFFDVVVYMKKKGYVLYDIFDGLNRPYDNALAQKDILFVKENGYFRQSHQYSKSS